jgi:hypothetical protein
MAIYEVTTNDVLQRCEKCGSKNTIALGSLEAGKEWGDAVDEHLVQLPPCPTCGATECLIRTPHDEPEYPVPGSFGHLHRLLVDSVHEKLVRQGRMVGALKKRKVESLISKTVAEKKHEKWLPSGLKLKLPEESRESEPPKK